MVSVIRQLPPSCKAKLPIPSPPPRDCYDDGYDNDDDIMMVMFIIIMIMFIMIIVMTIVIIIMTFMIILITIVMIIMHTMITIMWWWLLL